MERTIVQAEYETRTLSLVVVPQGYEIFSEMATTIEITDESGGEFVQVKQPGCIDGRGIAIDRKEWPALRAAIDQMIAQCRGTDNAKRTGHA